ncbi:uncharacterized protein LOC129617675 [Condylostylus longicornis]|uniref:uncharacterized protein LOC129617675 n=1 Tax=Condylostylus longicornis TaxID=2530218 RepID=UPI00244DC54F|nr:uncharacterized protein LOC129617675 [Condylostylus longicornis]
MDNKHEQLVFNIFVDAGGDPKELMAYMVKNPGLIPRDVREIPKKKQLMRSILWSSWPACFYVGFGSIVVDDIDSIYEKIFEGLKQTGTRALINKGWSSDKSKTNSISHPNFFVVDNVPHDWLFLRCSTVCHHGGEIMP